MLTSVNISAQSSGKKVIISGGGTGGHIFPAIAIANALKKLDASVEILFVGAKGKMEMQKVPEAGYPIIGITIAGFNRSQLLKNWRLPFQLIQGFWEVRKIFLIYIQFYLSKQTENAASNQKGFVTALDLAFKRTINTIIKIFDKIL